MTYFYKNIFSIFSYVLYFGGRRVGRSPLNSHPETGRRTTMCEASVALATERSAAGRATTRDEHRTERNRGRTKDGIRHPRRDAKHGSIKSKHGRKENAKLLKRFSTRNVFFCKM